MIDWLVTGVVLLIGWMILILGLLPYVFICFLVVLFLSVVSELLINILIVFSEDDK
jgi:hypothetical protein